MDRGVLAAVRRFPRRSLEIRRLAIADSAFRALCGDLAEAELALARWKQEPSQQAAARRSEYDLLVDELAIEIESIVERRSREQSSR
jgi:hypothetical protein